MTRIRVGITGQSGFIGSHLSILLSRKKDDIEIVPCEDEFFKSEESLRSFVERCDTIVHLAAMNRGSEQEVYETNVVLVQKLIEALHNTERPFHVLFSSSTQESLDNSYGRSKAKGRALLENWAKKSGNKLTTFAIPNVFGAYGRPFYNSVVATFSYQLTHQHEPELKIDSDLRLVYVNDLVAMILHEIAVPQSDKIAEVRINELAIRKVSAIRDQLRCYRDLYLINHMIPQLNSPFDVALFNTFRSYIDPAYFPVRLALHKDERGYLFETVKSLSGGQTFLSLTKPRIIRGNHYHTRKVERFCVIEGEAVIRLRRIGSRDVVEYRVSGDEPTYIDMPILCTHSIENVGTGGLITSFWSNEIFNPDDPDTYAEKVA